MSTVEKIKGGPMTLVKSLIIVMFLLLVMNVRCESNLMLETDTTILLQGEIDAPKADDTINQLFAMSILLPKEAVINMVIDSPGGSVYDGMRIIAAMEAIPQKINTTAIFAFSMAYSIFQRGEKRFISTFGTIGQHRAKGGFQGQFAEGEVESRLSFATQMITILNKYEAGRMGVSLKEFKELIKDEMWLMRDKAIDLNAADDVVIIKCSESLLLGKKTSTKRSDNLYSTEVIVVTTPACPLITDNQNL